MEVIVLLTLSASAIAMPPSGPSLLALKLKKEGVTKLDRNVVTERGNKKNLQRGTR